MALGRGWGGGGMVSTPAQLLQTSLLFYRITKQHGSGWGGFGGGVWGGGGHDKHMRAAARFPEYEITWFWGVGVGGAW